MKNIYIFFLFIFAININLSKQLYCTGYNKTVGNEKMCKGLTYRYNNEICFFDGVGCINITDGSDEIKKNANYTLTSEIHNNCGVAGFFEPKEDKDLCKGIPLVEGYCCWVNYTAGNEFYTACLRTKNYKNKNDIPSDIKDYKEGFTAQNFECKETFIKNSYLILISFLFFI